MANLFDDESLNLDLNIKVEGTEEVKKTGELLSKVGDELEKVNREATAAKLSMEETARQVRQLAAAEREMAQATGTMTQAETARELGAAARVIAPHIAASVPSGIVAPIQAPPPAITQLGTAQRPETQFHIASRGAGHLIVATNASAPENFLEQLDKEVAAHIEAQFGERLKNLRVAGAAQFVNEPTLGPNVFSSDMTQVAAELRRQGIASQMYREAQRMISENIGKSASIIPSKYAGDEGKAFWQMLDPTLLAERQRYDELTTRRDRLSRQLRGRGGSALSESTPEQIKERLANAESEIKYLESTLSGGSSFSASASRQTVAPPPTPEKLFPTPPSPEDVKKSELIAAALADQQSSRLEQIAKIRASTTLAPPPSDPVLVRRAGPPPPNAEEQARLNRLRLAGYGPPRPPSPPPPPSAPPGGAPPPDDDDEKKRRRLAAELLAAQQSRVMTPEEEVRERARRMAKPTPASKPVEEEEPTEGETTQERARREARNRARRGVAPPPPSPRQVPRGAPIYSLSAQEQTRRAREGRGRRLTPEEILARQARADYQASVGVMGRRRSSTTWEARQQAAQERQSRADYRLTSQVMGRNRASQTWEARQQANEKRQQAAEERQTRSERAQSEREARQAYRIYQMNQKARDFGRPRPQQSRGYWYGAPQPGWRGMFGQTFTPQWHPPGTPPPGAAGGPPAGGTGGPTGRRGGAGGGGGGGRGRRGTYGGGYLDSMVGALAYGAALRGLVQNLVEYAAKTQTAELVTRQLAKANSLSTESVLVTVDAVKQYNITTQDANKTIQRMMIAQLDVAKAPQLAQIGQNLGSITGVGSSEAMERMILGITTGQTRVLHNMGLQVSMIQVMRQLSAERASQGLVGPPSEYEKRQALLNQVIMQGASMMGAYQKSLLTAGGQFTILTRDAQETANVIGSEFLPVYGRFISTLIGGLGVIREHGETTSKVLTGLVSVFGALAANRLLSMGGSLLPGLLRGGPIGLGLTAATAIGTYFALNPNKSSAEIETAEEARGRTRDQLNEVLAQRRRLMTSPERGSVAWQNTLEISRRQEMSLRQADADIQDNLKDQLAANFREQNKNFQGSRTQRSFLDRFISPLALRPVEGGAWYSGIGRFLDPMGVIPGLRDLGKPTVTTAPGISETDVRKRIAEQDTEARRIRLADPTIVNRERQEAQRIFANMVEAREQLTKLDQQTAEGGTLERRAERMFESPRTKIQLDLREDIERVNRTVKEIKDLRSKVASGDPYSKTVLDKVYEQFGLGDPRLNAARAQEFIDQANKVVAQRVENYSLEAEALSRRTESEVMSSQQTVALERAKTNVVTQDTATRISALNREYQIRKDFADRDPSLRQDPDAYRKRIASAEEQRQVGLLQIQGEAARGAESLRQTQIRDLASFSGRMAMASPIPERQAILESYRAELGAAQHITSEIERQQAIYEANVRLRDQLVQAVQREASVRAEANASLVGRRAELSNVVDVAQTEARGQRVDSIALIERRTRRMQDAIRAQYEISRKVTPASDQDALRVNTQRNLIDAEIQGQEDLVEQRRYNIARSRQDAIQMLSIERERQVRVAELSAFGPTQEQDAAMNAFRTRMDLIQREKQLRGESIESEKQARKEMMEVEFDELQRQLSIQRQGMEETKQFAGGLFDTLTSHGENSLGKFFAEQYRSQAKTIFENTFSMVGGNMRGFTGSIFPGQDRIDAQGNRQTTFLGRMLSGTMFGVQHTEDIPRLQADIMRNNTDAQKELTDNIGKLNESIQNLDGTIKGQGGLPPVDYHGLGSLRSILPGLDQLTGGKASPIFGLTQSNAFADILPKSTPEVRGKIVSDAQAAGINPTLALSLARQESGGQQFATGGGILTSPKGAQGIMQLMPSTAREMSVNPQNTDQNIRGGVLYLSQLMKKYGDPRTALMAYDWGPGNVDKALATGGTIPTSVQRYADSVLSRAGMSGVGAGANDLVGVPPPSEGIIPGGTSSLAPDTIGNILGTTTQPRTSRILGDIAGNLDATDMRGMFSETQAEQPAPAYATQTPQSFPMPRLSTAGATPSPWAQYATAGIGLAATAIPMLTGMFGPMSNNIAAAPSFSSHTPGVTTGGVGVRGTSHAGMYALLAALMGSAVGGPMLIRHFDRGAKVSQPEWDPTTGTWIPRYYQSGSPRPLMRDVQAFGGLTQAPIPAPTLPSSSTVQDSDFARLGEPLPPTGSIVAPATSAGLATLSSIVSASGGSVPITVQPPTVEPQSLQSVLGISSPSDTDVLQGMTSSGRGILQGAGEVNPFTGTSFSTGAPGGFSLSNILNAGKSVGNIFGDLGGGGGGGGMFGGGGGGGGMFGGGAAPGPNTPTWDPSTNTEVYPDSSVGPVNSSSSSFNPFAGNTAAGDIGTGVQSLGGVAQALAGFKQGGARGDLAGTAGAMMAIAPFTGPAAPFLMAGSAALGMISSFLPDPKLARQHEVQAWMNQNKYVAPVTVKNLDETMTGDVARFSRIGQVTDSGVGMFPLSIQQNQFRLAMEKNGLFQSTHSYDPYTFIPGSAMVNTSNRGGPQVTLSAPITVHTMDSQSFIDNGPKIIGSVNNQLTNGSDLSVSLQNLIFGQG